LQRLKKLWEMDMRKTLTITGLAASLVLAGCTTNPDTGQRTMSRPGATAAAGAGAGALLGALLGGRNNRAEVLIGTGIGAIAGAAVGSYMDKQERDLRASTAGTGIEVEREGAEINLRMPSGVTFDFNSATLKPDFRPALDEVVTTLKAYPSTFIDVSGHSDAIGSDAVNQQLSEKRATAVADYLTYQGIAQARIATKGYGKQFPVASNDTEEGRAQNRRVEIKLSPVTEQDLQGATKPG
jgi:outer membrane protein OmpA-like peptidoglycan-associated protein